MKRNLGNFDKLLRVLIAAVIGVLYFTHIVIGTWGIILLIVGAILLATSFINFCPLYFLLGINTNSNQHKKTAA